MQPDQETKHRWLMFPELLARYISIVKNSRRVRGKILSIKAHLRTIRLGKWLQNACMI
jgi:hypothetical protein